jgi:hypothetical protein
MTAAAYTTDLTSVDSADTSTYVALTATGWTAAGSVSSAETDAFIQGVACCSKSLKSGLGGLMTPALSNFTIPTDGAVLIWGKITVEGLIGLKSAGGIRTVIGNSQSVFYGYIQGGSDTYAYGGWLNMAMNDTVSADYTLGSPASPWQRVAFVGNITFTGSLKGNPFLVDASYVGRCEARFAGGTTPDPAATFSGYAAQNDNVSNRWGLIQAIEGGYRWQGLMVLGHGAAVRFTDANVNLVVANTEKVTANFNTIEVRDASSVITWTAVSIAALGTVSRGRWVTTDDATVDLEGCTFTDMGVFGFLANTTALDCTFRRTDLITLAGATLTGCTIDRNRATSAVLAATPAGAALVSGCTFVSDGTGHGLEITGAAASIALTSDTWTGYAGTDGSTGNEAVYVNIATGSLNLTITGGTIPSVRTAGCVVTVISGAVSATATVTTASGTAIQSAVVMVKASNGTGPFPFEESVTIVNSGTTATVTHAAHGLATNDKVLIQGASLVPNNGIFLITVTAPGTYTYTMLSAPGSSPTGTIVSTFIVLSGTTDVTGEITMSRVFGSAQPVTGWARKSSATPFYKTGPINGSVSSTLGASLSAVLVLDE